MTYAGNGFIMLFRTHDKGNASDRGEEALHFFSQFVRKSLPRCKQIISIFQEKRIGGLIAGNFRTGHGMPAYKSGRKSQFFRFLHDGGFGRADIR